MESIGGEDPYLGQVFAQDMVKAHKEVNDNKEDGIISCVKHFAAYGAVEAGRDYNSVDMSQREFRQYYLPAYKSAIDSGAEMIMTSFNIINGIPATVNKWLLTDMLRKELGFKGIVISDYSAIEETIEHGVAKDKKEAAYKLGYDAGYNDGYDEGTKRAAWRLTYDEIYDMVIDDVAEHLDIDAIVSDYYS